MEVFRVAVKRSTIAVMETGSGKTMIAVMLIKHIGLAINSTDPKKLIIFLAPTVHLVHQQYEVIKSHTNFRVGEYFGAKGVDEWSVNCWEKEIHDHDVLVMTPQILLDALRKAFLCLEAVSLLIFDECHHATGNHPYAKIMKEFYHKSDDKPKIFGMTASPVVRKGVSSTINCESQISELEIILDSQIYTIEDKKEMELHIPFAKENCIFYEKAGFQCQDLKDKIEALWSKLNLSMSILQEKIHYRDMEDKFKTLRNRLSNDRSKIFYCLDNLGLICAYEAAKVCLNSSPGAIEECVIYRESCLQYKLLLEEVLRMIGEFCQLGNDVFLDFGLKAVDSGYISPKLYELLQLFRSFGESRQVLCLIFVERIVAAKVIDIVVKKVAYLSHFKVSYITGHNSTVGALAPGMQKETLESFCSGKVNLLFATDVVEEGIHVPKCSCVVRFDLPTSVRSYVQSRGRARQENSRFFMMLERGNMKQRDQLFEVIRSEWSMTDAAMNRDPAVHFVNKFSIAEISSYVVKATGASVTADSSVSLIYQYCEKLPHDEYSTVKPLFEYSCVEKSYECKLTLPLNAAVQTVVGPLARNYHLSRQLVCLEACKKLHQVGVLDDHLRPFTKEPSELDLIVKSEESASGAGTTRRKELHGTTHINALSGTWGKKVDGVIFQAYKFDFTCSNAGEIFSGFVLLMESKLDNDVGNTELELYLVSKMVKTSVSLCGEVHLDAEQVRKVKYFQELFFNGLFGRLFTGSKSNGKGREFLLKKDSELLWNPLNMYLVLPLDTFNAFGHDSWEIDWRGIDFCASLVEFMKQNSLLGAEISCGDKLYFSPIRTVSTESECADMSVVHLANGLVDANNIKDMVVLAIHTGRIYSVLEVVADSSAGSPFDGKIDSLPSEHNTFADYFKGKYGIVLKHPQQALLRLKQSHNPHNLLVNFNEEGNSDEVLQSGPASKKPYAFVHMPPELLVRIDISRGVLKSAYLLPSLMHRLESLMLASELRKDIEGPTSGICISSSSILEAVTTLRCCESFSMERLEFLGDSVLKYVVSCHLFLKYPEKHEGKLTGRRSSVICNANLHKLGTNRKLQGYIRDSAFDPRRWVAPGQHPLRPVPCKCGVDTFEVPLDHKFLTEDPKVVLGKTCDKGHRWMVSKTIADCVEALIGVYYINGGLIGALHVMKWLGFDAELDSSLVLDVITTASLRSYVPKGDEIMVIESKIGYEFTTKGLLQEAITHPSEQELGAGYCYERLEFLGDSALDILITRYLYQNHLDLDQGELTDLRSASVSNEYFAQVAVRRNLQQHLQHRSMLLLSQITEYVNFLTEPSDPTKSLRVIKGPKALGDMIESIAGAILIDTNLQIDEVWSIYEPLLSPIVTPDKLDLAPFRELNEWCDSLGYYLKEKCTRRGEQMRAELRLQLKDDLLIGDGLDRSRKDAKGEAARCILKQLEVKGIYTPRSVSKKRKPNPDPVGDLPCQDTDKDFSCPKASKNLKITQVSELDLPAESSIPVIGAIKTDKGGPRTTLFELCKKLQWPRPTFKTTEDKSRTPIEIAEDSEKRKGFNSFVSRATLHIPNSGSIECGGHARLDKKSSFDSAALAVLHELQRQGKLTINDS